MRDVLHKYLDFREQFRSSRIYKIVESIESIPKSGRWVGYSFIVDMLITRFEIPLDVLDQLKPFLRGGKERFRKQFSIFRETGCLDSIRQNTGHLAEPWNVTINSLIRLGETSLGDEEPTGARPDQNKSQADDQRMSQTQDPTNDPTKELREPMTPAVISLTKRQMEKQVGRDPEWKRARGIRAVGKYVYGTKIPLPGDSHIHKMGKTDRTNTPVDDLKQTAKTRSIQAMKDDPEVFRTSGQQCYEIKDAYAWILLEEMI